MGTGLCSGGAGKGVEALGESRRVEGDEKHRRGSDACFNGGSTVNGRHVSSFVRRRVKNAIDQADRSDPADKMPLVAYASRENASGQALPACLPSGRRSSLGFDTRFMIASAYFFSSFPLICFLLSLYRDPYFLRRWDQWNLLETGGL